MQLSSVFLGPDRDEPRGQIIQKGLGSNQILENKQCPTLCMQTLAVWIKGAEFAASDPANVKLLEKIQHGPEQTNIKGNVIDLLFLQWKLKCTCEHLCNATLDSLSHGESKSSPKCACFGVILFHFSNNVCADGADDGIFT